MPEPKRRPIIIDTDPGQDDAVAILLALAADNQLDVLGITTVAGNVPVALTSRNARIVLGWANRTDVPVYAGCPGPLIRGLMTAETIHGESGLDGVPLEEPKVALAKEHAVEFLIGTLCNAPKESVTLCLLGPMTNLATALIQVPEIKFGIKEVVVMGGGYHIRGNVTPVAEFNVHVDPHAADVVFRSGISIVVLPLDVTHKAPSTQARIARIENTGNPTAKLVAAILRSHTRHQTGSDGGPLHDPCVIAYLLQPTLFSGRHVNVVVETAGQFTLGETVVDWNRVTERAPNAYWITDINADAFYYLLAEMIGRLP
jgi:purine nucleosidase